MKNRVDETVAKGSVYHIMCHPNVIEWDKAYTWSHLNHISNHNNIWYVSLGHLFTYHLAQTNYSVLTTVADKTLEVPGNFSLHQNFPNPFNPVTTINYIVSKSALVKLTVYNSLGQTVEVLVNKNQSSGEYFVRWDASEYESGIYFYQIRIDGFQENRKMILMK